MIAMTMAYLAVVAVAASIAAVLAEAGLRRLGRATRGAWLAAMGAGPALLLVGSVVRWSWGASTSLPSGLPVALDLQALLVTMAKPDQPWWHLAQRTLLFAWVGSSVVFLGVVLRAYLRLAREMRAWRVRRVRRATVFVSRRRGPAVSGLIRPWIVVPEWVLRLPADELRMVLRHESEHLKAGDSRLVLLGLLLAGFTPWNPISWWQLRRLRTAVEIDCDRRVLARDGDVRTYGATLLSVAAGVMPDRSLAFAAFSESSSSLRTRIVAMTTRRSGTARAAGALMVVAAALVGVQACGVENPMAPTAPAEDPTPAAAPVARPTTPTASVVGTPVAPAPAPAISETPSFTPFTVAPQLTNREVVGRALESNYPPLVRDAGVSGKVDIWVRITEKGLVDGAAVHTSSGHEALDQAALRIGRVMTFVPAQNRGAVVPVWVAIPITFQARPVQK